MPLALQGNGAGNTTSSMPIAPGVATGVAFGVAFATTGVAFGVTTAAPIIGSRVTFTSDLRGAPPGEIQYPFMRGQTSTIRNARAHEGQWYATSDGMGWFPLSSTDWVPSSGGGGGSGDNTGVVFPVAAAAGVEVMHPIIPLANHYPKP
jgi:hypothetical protein